MDWFQSLSSREQKLVVATAVVAVVCGLYIGIQTLLSTDTGTEISDAAASQFHDVLEKIDNIDKQKSVNFNLKKRLGNGKGFFVTDKETSRVVSEIEKVAGQSGVQLKGQSPTTNKRAKPFPSVDVRMSMECEFPQLITFFSNLKKAEIVLQPSSLKVQLKDPNQNKLEVQLTVTSYFLNLQPKRSATS